MQVQPYLFFEGRCEEAIEFYKRALGAQVKDFMRFKDSPEPIPPGAQDGAAQCAGGEQAGPEKVLHASFLIGETEVMASDGMCSGAANFQGIALAVSPSNAAEAERMYAALGEGGQVQMPLGPTFFSPCFGMVADRFGVSWMIVVAP